MCQNEDEGAQQMARVLVLQQCGDACQQRRLKRATAPVDVTAVEGEVPARLPTRAGAFGVPLKPRWVRGA